MATILGRGFRQALMLALLCVALGTLALSVWGVHVLGAQDPVFLGDMLLRTGQLLTFSLPLQLVAEVPLSVHGHGYVADTTEQAAEEFYPSYAAAMSRIGRERGWGPMTRQQYDAMRAPGGSLVLGDPETVAAKILHWQKVLGVTRFELHVSVGTLPHDKVLRSIELLGTEVARLVRE